MQAGWPRHSCARVPVPRVTVARAHLLALGGAGDPRHGGHAAGQVQAHGVAHRRAAGLLDRGGGGACTQAIVATLS